MNRRMEHYYGYKRVDSGGEKEMCGDFGANASLYYEYSTWGLIRLYVGIF